jgi:hypothetical protein
VRGMPRLVVSFKSPIGCFGALHQFRRLGVELVAAEFFADDPPVLVEHDHRGPFEGGPVAGEMIFGWFKVRADPLVFDDLRQTGRRDIPNRAMTSQDRPTRFAASRARSNCAARWDRRF